MTQTTENIKQFFDRKAKEKPSSSAEQFFVPEDWLFKTERYAQKQTHGKVVKVKVIK